MLSPYRKWSIDKDLYTYKKATNSVYKNYELNDRPKSVKPATFSGKNPYSKFSYGKRKQEIDDMIEDAQKDYESRGWADLHVERAISWASDIHPNGPEPSTVVTWIEYDGKSKILTFGLVAGGSREYHNVEADEAFEFTEADSKGRFVISRGW